MGHGAGTDHLKDREFYNKNINCSMMIFGCSSACMCKGKIEPHGIVHSYLINECPCVLGCLWEVTDQEIDKVTFEIFKNIKKER